MIVIIFILSTATFAFIGLSYMNKKQRVKKRVDKFILNREQQVVVKNEDHQTKTMKRPPIRQLIERLARNIKTSDNKRNRLELELESAGIPLRVEELITIRLVIFTLAGAFTLLIWGNFLVSIVVGFIGWKIPTFYIHRKKQARVEDCAQQLPESLEIMASSMKSGYSFMQAMQLVSKEMPNPIGIEFQRTIKEINLGVSNDEAFENLLERLPNKDLEIVVTAVLIQRATGGNLAQILETIQETISERVRMKDELKALTSQGRMSALVITLLPVVLGLLLNVMNPDYFTPMFTHPLGWVLLGGGVVSGILGWIFIQKVVTIEV